MHLKYSRVLNRVYKNENLIENLSSLFGVRFQKDWMGRIYAVFNPHIQEGMFDPNKQIYEYNEQGLSNKAYVESYIMNRLNVAEQFIMTNNLFDLLTYEIRQIDEYDNYLFIMKPITMDDCLKYTKKFAILIGALLIIGGILIYFI